MITVNDYMWSHSSLLFFKCTDKAWGMVNYCSGSICLNPQKVSESVSWIKQSSSCRICTAIMKQDCFSMHTASAVEYTEINISPVGNWFVYIYDISLFLGHEWLLPCVYPRPVQGHGGTQCRERNCHHSCFCWGPRPSSEYKKKMLVVQICNVYNIGG